MRVCVILQALRIVDPSGIVLEKVCGPVREYLYNRDDTVRCIVASLTNDSDSELAEVLMYVYIMCPYIYTFKDAFT